MGAGWCMDDRRSPERWRCRDFLAPSPPPSCEMGTSLDDGCRPNRVPGGGVFPRMKNAHLPAVCSHGRFLGRLRYNRYDYCRCRFGHKSGHLCCCLGRHAHGRCHAPRWCGAPPGVGMCMPPAMPSANAASFLRRLHQARVPQHGAMSSQTSLSPECYVMMKVQLLL